MRLPKCAVALLVQVGMKASSRVKHFCLKLWLRWKWEESISGTEFTTVLLTLGKIAQGVRTATQGLVPGTYVGYLLVVSWLVCLGYLLVVSWCICLWRRHGH